ncbi:protein of unknown function DUF151 [Thermobaculum terrenum ATCC BAA-798]|uniref:BFN domain-containing protein n=1 Tax=Thermobaculum terrenum (strain ATCC BAA-798 / CCMEE 7001 / YNP1) TaxID=525904 RepID=D1CFY0_THET1|nr:bifunctional nuclease family protein [Thermobaculum terrenum]ACZ41836.1 protein of unknown function DUF151 [Thermobaculum terrenum ATCC BAA-798]
MIETVIQAVRINVVNEQHVVLLKEVGGSRVIPIWIDPYQAHQIALHLGGREIARPMTHDLMNSIITEMGGVVERVIVNDLRDQTFFALVEIDQGGKKLLIDSRPSDAINLAIRSNASIYVEDHVMDQAGFVLPVEQEEAQAPESEKESSEISDIDNERLAVFREFINSLDLDEPNQEKKE